MPLRPQRASTLILLTVAIGCEDPDAPASCDPDNTLEAYSPFAMTREICFQDPNGDVLTYDVAISDPALADVALVGTTLTVTGKDAGETEITVTAMDPHGRIGTAPYTLTVTPAWASGFSTCDGWYLDDGAEVAISAWIKANTWLAVIRHELYVNGELRNVRWRPALSPGEMTGFGVRWHGPDVNPDIECSHIVTAQPVTTQL